MSKLTDFPVYSAKTKKRVKYGILGSGMIVVLVLAALLTRSPVLDTPPGKISVSMTAQVYRDGVLLGERVNDDDMLLNNFINLTQGLFYWPNDATYYIDLRSAMDSQWGEFTVWNETAGATIWDTDNADRVAFASFGEGTDPPERSDFDLDGNVFAAEIDYDVYSSDADGFTITWIWTSDGSYDWAQTALGMDIYSSNLESTWPITFVKDTFTPISVVADDSLVCNYRFTFSTGYTSNAINLLYNFFIGAVEDGTRSATLTDSGGSSRTVRLYTATASEEEFYGHFSDVFHGGWITITDSSSGIPSRSAYIILGSSATTQSLSSVDLSPNYDVVVRATIIPSSALTVRAAGSFMYLAYVGGDAYFLMWALGHTAVYVAANTPVQATFTLEL